jgi:DNA-binding NarL/FixJ family response regulator
VITDGLRALIDSRPDMRVVALASNGADAVRSCLASRPDVAVMDQAMPEMNGTEAVRMIRERCAATRVVMLSMYSNSEHVRRALEAGANGYVLKSSAGDELVEAIRTVHSGRRYLSAPLADELLERMINGSADALSRLSARERQVLKLLADGHSVLHIAGTLSLSRKTVETYRERLMEKLGLRDLPSLVKFALRHGVVELE